MGRYPQRGIFENQDLKAKWNPAARDFVSLAIMEERYGWSWVETQVEETIKLWNGCALSLLPDSPRYAHRAQRKSEKAYDRAMRGLRREGSRKARTPAERLLAQQRIVALFPEFAAIALGLDNEQAGVLTGSFLPAGTELARWARGFDPDLGMEDTIQACRNAWTCCGLQALLGQAMELTPSTLAYSLLYPYSDNCLDHPGLTTDDKLRFSERFRQRLRGQRLLAGNPREAAVWTMVQLIEEQYPRREYPQVFDCLLAIHRAQEESMAQLKSSRRSLLDRSEVLRISCAKGGTSVLADACLVQPWLTPEEYRFAFDWGVLLQLGDDLQDVGDDLRRGSVTLFTQAAALGQPLDGLARQLLHFSAQIADRMDSLHNGSPALKNLLRMSWRSLILMAVAEAHTLFSPEFLAELEPYSSFRFNFLRARNEKLTGRESLYAVLFDAFIEAGTADRGSLPLPGGYRVEEAPVSVPALPVLSNSFA